MKTKNFFLVLFLFLGTLSFSQITIDRNDMPNENDTIRLSTTITVNGIDYTLTGEDYTWDFSSLSSLNQRVDTFCSVLSTPIVYQIVFPYYFVATIASPKGNFDLIPNLQFSNYYQYYKESNSAFKDVGFGITFNGIPIPIKYDEADVLYNFPMQFGNSNISNSGFEINIPSLIYLGIEKQRTNTVDGWGTLITPFGSFETLRLKSEIVEHDSIYIDSLGIGFPINRSYTEYKWLGKEQGLPLLTITQEGLLTTVEFIDSINSGSPGEITQTISLDQGYQFISTRLEVEDNDMLNLLANNLNDNLDFVRNSAGETLRKIGPNWVNGIGDWITTEGYLFKMHNQDVLEITGTEILAQTPISLEAGYQFVSYLPADTIDAMEAFASILNENLEFIRNSQGSSLRKIGPNWVNGLGDCFPGEAYLIKMTSDAVLIYP